MLKTLKISQCRSAPRTIISLLQRNPVIENLGLRYIIHLLPRGIHPSAPYNPTVEWEPAVNLMRRMQLKRLDLIGIEGFGRHVERFGDENQNLRLSAIQDYILHGYGDNPLRQDQNMLDYWYQPTREWDKELW